MPGNRVFERYDGRSANVNGGSPSNRPTDSREIGASSVKSFHMSAGAPSHAMDGTEDSGEVTIWLRQWAQGEPTALEHLAPLVYDQLRTIADNLLRNEAPDHTLQPTALVSETFLKLLDVQKVTLNDRSHFFAFAARLMRRVLIDHARRLKAAKRSVAGRLPLDSELAWTDSLNERSLDLSTALEELEVLDATGLRALELRYFLGCTGEETAALLGVSASTIDRTLRFSLAWLHDRLHPKS